MSPPPRSVRLSCLAGELPEYAAGRLPPERRVVWDLHLVSCAVCRSAVTDERRLQAALADGPTLPGDLRSALLAMAIAPEPAPAPVPIGAVPLATLTPTAPPYHRSVLRAAVLAAAAAGLSAAAAWSLGLTGSATGIALRSTPLLRTSASTGEPSPGSDVGNFAASIVRFSSPSVESGGTRRAQSTP